MNASRLGGGKKVRIACWVSTPNQYLPSEITEIKYVDTLPDNHISISVGRVPVIAYRTPTPSRASDPLRRTGSTGTDGPKGLVSTGAIPQNNLFDSPSDQQLGGRAQKGSSNRQGVFTLESKMTLGNGSSLPDLRLIRYTYPIFTLIAPSFLVLLIWGERGGIKENRVAE